MNARRAALQAARYARYAEGRRVDGKRDAHVAPRVMPRHPPTPPSEMSDADADAIVFALLPAMPQAHEKAFTPYAIYHHTTNARENAQVRARGLRNPFVTRTHADAAAQSAERSIVKRAPNSTRAAPRFAVPLQDDDIDTPDTRSRRPAVLIH